MAGLSRLRRAIDALFADQSGELAAGLSGCDAHEPASRSRLRLATVLRSLGTLSVGIPACLAIILLQPTASTDQQLSDWMLRDKALSANADFLLVEISAEDLRTYGRPLLARENLALLLESMADDGPERVLLDLHLASRVDPAADDALAAALARYPRNRLGLVSGTFPQDNPDLKFARFGRVFDVRLIPDDNGWHSRLGQAGERGANAARWMADGTISAQPAPIDLRIDERGYQRVDAGAVLTGEVHAAGRRVIVAAGPEVAPTRAYLPGAPAASRAMVIAAAAQSVGQGYDQRLAIGERANLALQLLAMLFGFGCAALASSGRRLLLLTFGALVLLSFAHSSVAATFGTPVSPLLASVCFFLMLGIALVRRFRFVGLLGNFLRGDLSPEEAWGWRSASGSSLATVMFAADGSIKRCNAAADEIVSSFGDRLGTECQPRLGLRVSEITLSNSEGENFWFVVDWPLGKLPIAVLRDVTESKTRERVLLDQLFEDPLTRCLNRRGLDHQLNLLRRHHRPFALMFMDLNGFKGVNDKYGHEGGDDLLQQVAEVLREHVREEDFVVRLGGDEFAVLMPGTWTRVDLEGEADRLTDSFSRPFRLEATAGEILVSAAVGFAVTDAPGEEATAVMRRADLMMYDRKAAMKRDTQVA